MTCYGVTEPTKSFPIFKNAHSTGPRLPIKVQRLIKRTPRFLVYVILYEIADRRKGIPVGTKNDGKRNSRCTERLFSITVYNFHKAIQLSANRQRTTNKRADPTPSVTINQLQQHNRKC